MFRARSRGFGFEQTGDRARRRWQKGRRSLNRRRQVSLFFVLLFAILDILIVIVVILILERSLSDPGAALLPGGRRHLPCLPLLHPEDDQGVRESRHLSPGTLSGPGQVAFLDFLHLRLHPPILCQGSRPLLCSSLPRSLLRRRSPHKNTLRAPARGLCTFFIIIIITINQCSLSGVVSIHLLLRFTPWTV